MGHSLATFVIIGWIAAASSFAGEPPLVTATEMQAPNHLDRSVRVRGTVRDVFPDELNPNYAFLIILSETGPVCAAVQTDKLPLTDLRKLIDARIEATGFCRPTCVQDMVNCQPRLYFGRILDLKGPDSFNILTPAPENPFTVPEVREKHDLYPYQLQQLGRHRAFGHVLAVWNGNTVLIETKSGSMMRVELTDGPLPSCGDFIETVGYPDTDIFRINFTRAIWRPAEPWPTNPRPVRDLTAAEILTDGQGRTKVDVRLYGQPIRLTGTVRTLPDATSGKSVFFLDNGGFLLPVDISSCRDAINGLTAETVIQATGICILNVENWRPNAVFPQIDGFTLVVRDAHDLIVLSRPSGWKTVRRLSIVLAALLLVLAAIIGWNLSLRKLAERRGRALADEQIGRATAELKIDERTRFAADLHDSLSQTLSGIAMQLGAIKRFAKTDAEQMLRHLDIASRTLKSCRDDMRMLLWDLRSQVLDEPDIEKAFRQILEPHLENTNVHVRFTVPRARLSDSTARALFCIIRELTVNAIRHGRAKSVRIAGSLESGRLLCSVRDDGCGFDPAKSPGVGEGHFGLQGIRERIDALEGTVIIESAPGKGSKVTISLPAHNDGEQS